MSKLTLISSPTCPYVQRAVIALKEKQVPFEVIYVDLANKPDWFLAISPLGKVPVLKVEREGKPDAVIFESAVILEYLEETASGVKMHPSDPLERARNRAWIEVASSFLGDLGKLGRARTGEELDAARLAISGKLKLMESTLMEGPYFSGPYFSFVDAAFGPAFRQLDVIETINHTGLLDGFPRLEAWRRALATRPSVASAVPDNYAELYLERLRKHHALVLKEAA
jgi:glutathione S-transferase